LWISMIRVIAVVICRPPKSARLQSPWQGLRKFGPFQSIQSDESATAARSARITAKDMTTVAILAVNRKPAPIYRLLPARASSSAILIASSRWTSAPPAKFKKSFLRAARFLRPVGSQQIAALAGRHYGNVVAAALAAHQLLFRSRTVVSFP
jgi:hypothetical protein